MHKHVEGDGRGAPVGRHHLAGVVESLAHQLRPPDPSGLAPAPHQLVSVAPDGLRLLVKQDVVDPAREVVVQLVEDMGRVSGAEQVKFAVA